MRAFPLVLAAVVLAGCGPDKEPVAVPSLNAEPTVETTVAATTPPPTGS